MTDQITLNPGVGGSNVATETIGGVEMPISKLYLGAHGANGGPVTAANPMPTHEAALGTWKPSWFLVGNVAVQILPSPLANRQGLMIWSRQDNDASNPIWIGTTSGITVGGANAIPLFPGQPIPADLAASATAIWAICATSGQHMDAIEVGT